MANVLCFAPDEKLFKILDESFKDVRKSLKENYTVFHVKEKDEFEEALILMVYNVIFIEQKLIGEDPSSWLKKFIPAHPRVKGKYVLVGDELDSVKIMSFMEAGWTDYIVSPPDKNLLLEKISIISTGERFKDRQVYNMATNELVHVAKPANIEVLSEVDCKMRSPYQMPVDSYMILISTAFGENGSSGNALGRCYKSEPIEGAEGEFYNFFNFVGVTPPVLQNIRATLRRAYINQKFPKST